MGDLHPGGASAISRILHWLAERKVRRVLEIGAGIGNTAARMVSLGWDVTALEPDPILFATLRKRLGEAARCETFLSHGSTAPHDAIIAESVFFQMDLAQVFARCRGLLKPGAYLAFVEAVWTEGISGAKSRGLHELTQRLFGIAVGSGERLTWQDWCRQLRNCGFATECAQLLPRGSAGHPPSRNWRASIAAIAHDPTLLLWMARYRLRKRGVSMPPAAQESWLIPGKTSEHP
jgi:SAM-dependent methyltransferase